VVCGLLPHLGANHLLRAVDVWPVLDRRYWYVYLHADPLWVAAVDALGVYQMGGTEEMSTWATSTIQQALYLAIKTQREVEKGYGYTGPSAMLACWEQMLKEIQAGQQLVIRHD